MYLSALNQTCPQVEPAALSGTSPQEHRFFKPERLRLPVGMSLKNTCPPPTRFILEKKSSSSCQVLSPIFLSTSLSLNYNSTAFTDLFHFDCLYVKAVSVHSKIKCFFGGFFLVIYLHDKYSYQESLGNNLIENF